MNPNECTLYSSGHKGTEAEFGTQAERWGVQEVNFSYEGREPVRNRGVVVLSPEEMMRGDISMEIVCMHMGRSYSSVETIRKVMQLLFHMVNKGFQVFGIGWIQPNDTVKGGTGWAIELAKLFNRPLSVFDLQRGRWFTWEDRAWAENEPVIEHGTFVGTGTRNLPEAGRRAIEDLYRRSFDASAKR
jgi:hypothetical protein